MSSRRSRQEVAGERVVWASLLKLLPPPTQTERSRRRQRQNISTVQTETWGWKHKVFISPMKALMLKINLLCLGCLTLPRLKKRSCDNFSKSSKKSQVWTESLQSVHSCVQTCSDFMQTRKWWTHNTELAAAFKSLLSTDYKTQGDDGKSRAVKSQRWVD